jgi:hypothetical protein
MPRLFRIVPLVVLTLAASGCYLDHGLGPEPRPDGAVPPPLDGGSPALDSGRRVDAGRVDAGRDAGLECPIQRADWACFESFAMPPGRPFELPLTVDACECCPQAECAVEVDEAARTLRVTTTSCPGLCDCLACNSATAACQVPALPEGTWTVEINGTPAMRLPVIDEPGLIPPPAACVDFAEPDECTGEEALEGRAQNVSEACVRQMFGGQYVIELRDECGTCDREGPCIVTAEARDDLDLPPGMEIRVDARRFFGACAGDCGAACFETTRRCVLPPLAEGDVHRVYVNGLGPFTFVGGEAEACSGG